MTFRSYTAGILGIEGHVITVEAEVGGGLPWVTIADSVDRSCDETIVRVRAAINHADHLVPTVPTARRQVVKLAPAQHEGSPGRDLAIACALLSSHGIIPGDALTRTMLWAELASDGTLRPAVGTLIVADTARQQGFLRMIVAEASADEASMIPDLEVLAMHSLADVVALLRGEREPHAWERRSPQRPGVAGEGGPDLADIRGQPLPRLALEIMIAGGHNLLLHGPSGAGKTMLARRIPSLMPDLNREDAIEVTKLYGIAHRKTTGLITRPPVRMPHHTVSAVGMLGGGNPPRPGEVSLAHRGVLFLDELPEFPRSYIEGLREVLQTGVMTFVRGGFTLHYPARFQLMAAMNLCPCGFMDHPERVCIDNPAAVQRYQGRVSVRLLDRMDLVVPIAPLTAEETSTADPGQPSAVVRERILAARERQHVRLRDTPWANNAQIPSAEAIEQLCPLTDDARKLLFDLARDHELSTCAVDHLRRVGRTIQDLDPDIDPREPIRADAVALAVRLRRLPAVRGDRRDDHKRVTCRHCGARVLTRKSNSMWGHDAGGVECPGSNTQHYDQKKPRPT